MKRVITISLLLLSTSALAQYDNRVIYDGKGNVAARTTTSSSGQTTIYGTHGDILGRTAPTSEGTTVIYDGSGKRVGTVNRENRKDR